MMNKQAKTERRRGRRIAAIAASVFLAASATLATGGTAAAAAPANTTQPESNNSSGLTWCRYEVTVDNLNVRDRPFLDADVLYQLNEGDLIWATSIAYYGDGVLWRSLNYSGSGPQHAAADYLEQIPRSCYDR